MTDLAAEGDGITTRPRIAVLLVAAGRGTRAAGPGVDKPKQYRLLAGESVLSRTIRAFLSHPAIGSLAVVIHPDDGDLYAEATAGFDDPRLLPPVPGGRERQESVYFGLIALAGAASPDVVLIHDAVRPFIGAPTIDATLDGLARHPAVVVGIPVVDTVKRTGADGVVLATVPRDGMWRASTPQGFGFDLILGAHRKAATSGANGLTDDAAVAEWAGIGVRMVRGEDGNVKLTTNDDFTAAERRLHLDRFTATADVRVGTGYDVHALEPGDGVWLCGVRIPHSHRLRGHSDADVALHALTDALLGALGDGDIGRHFPPSEAEWRGAASSVFLSDAVRRVRERGGLIAHCDVSLIAEAPKIGPHREAMREKIAEICGISLDRVGVKATTNEGLGFAGRREGIAAIATATIRLPVADPGR